jgi:hypothetical protein
MPSSSLVATPSPTNAPESTLQSSISNMSTSAIAGIVVGIAIGGAVVILGLSALVYSLFCKPSYKRVSTVKVYVKGSSV